MPPVVILIRHGEAEHNDYHLHDPRLTEKGRKQCSRLNNFLLEHEPLVKEIGLVICSPLIRTIETMMLGLEGVVGLDAKTGTRTGETYSGKEVEIIFDARWQENSSTPCDTGSPISSLQELFPTFKDELAAIDPTFPRKIGLYAFTQAANLDRGRLCLYDLYARPEKVVVAISHAGFLRTAISQSFYSNADYRVFDFAELKEGGDVGVDGGQLRLVERTRTREQGGGLGESWKGPAGIELGDFPPELVVPEDEDGDEEMGTKIRRW